MARNKHLMARNKHTTSPINTQDVLRAVEADLIQTWHSGALAAPTFPLEAAALVKGDFRPLPGRALFGIRYLLSLKPLHRSKSFFNGP